jgi:hypothetical protein
VGIVRLIIPIVAERGDKLTETRFSGQELSQIFHPTLHLSHLQERFVGGHFNTRILQNKDEGSRLLPPLHWFPVMELTQKLGA